MNKQNQHIVSQVYLKQFGYVENNQWKVSVLKLGEHFTRQKNIKSFLAEYDIFKIDSNDENIINAFENLNTEIENYYRSILSNIESNKPLSDNNQAILLQYISNLIVRSKICRKYIVSFSKHENYKSFLRLITKNQSEEFIMDLINQGIDYSLNRILILYMNYLYESILIHYDIIILKSVEGKAWFTSDNPVIIYPKYSFNFKLESEFYFPFTSEFLIYLHNKNSEQNDNPHKFLESNIVHEAETTFLDKFAREIAPRNAIEYVIMPDKIQHRFQE